MIRSSIFAAASIVALMSTPACDKASADQQQADKAQETANDKINAARRDADQKVNQAQAEADKKIADAQANFTKLSEDYRHSMATSLTDLDHKIADLEAKEKTVTGKAKADLDASLKQIHASRDALATDFQALQSTAAANWDAAKARVDKELSDLQALVTKS
jgi:vacuolar-type H+-ATPase subunit E/Vma4